MSPIDLFLYCVAVLSGVAVGVLIVSVALMIVLVMIGWAKSSSTPTAPKLHPTRSQEPPTSQELN